MDHIITSLFKAFKVLVQLITHMLLVTNLTNTKCKEPEKWLKPWYMGTHRRVLSKSSPMNTNMTGFR